MQGRIISVVRSALLR